MSDESNFVKELRTDDLVTFTWLENNERKVIGRIIYKDGKVLFIGDTDKCAEIFFNNVCCKLDEFINSEVGKHMERIYGKSAQIH